MAFVIFLTKNAEAALLDCSSWKLNLEIRWSVNIEEPSINVIWENSRRNGGFWSSKMEVKHFGKSGNHADPSFELFGKVATGLAYSKIDQEYGISLEVCKPLRTLN